jgi:hypothetical protein
MIAESLTEPSDMQTEHILRMLLDIGKSVEGAVVRSGCEQLCERRDIFLREFSHEKRCRKRLWHGFGRVGKIWVDEVQYPESPWVSWSSRTSQGYGRMVRVPCGV